MEHPIKRLSDRISLNAHKFTPSDHLIADYLLRDYPVSFMQNASEIAEELNINVSTVTRFFPKIGYRNLKEILADFRQDIQFLINSPLDRFISSNLTQTEESSGMNAVMDLDWSNIQHTFNMVDQEKVNEFIKLIVDRSRKVFVLGTRKEFSLAYYFYYQTFSFRDNAFLLETNRLIDQFSEIQKDDLLVVFDFRRYSRTHELASRYAAETNARVVVFSDSMMAPSANFADHVFLVNTRGGSVFDSYTSAVALINFLFIGIIKASGSALKTKYERLEKLYKSFDIFSFQKSHLKKKT